jgi:hypothetical protein
MHRANADLQLAEIPLFFFLVHRVNADLQLAEIPLFTLNKILLPGSELPLQIDKDNLGGKEMIDRSSRGGGAMFVFVFGNQGYFKGYVLPLLFFFKKRYCIYSVHNKHNTQNKGYFKGHVLPLLFFW